MRRSRTRDCEWVFIEASQWEAAHAQLRQQDRLTHRHAERWPTLHWTGLPLWRRTDRYLLRDPVRYGVDLFAQGHFGLRAALRTARAAPPGQRWRAFAGRFGLPGCPLDVPRPERRVVSLYRLRLHLPRRHT